MRDGMGYKCDSHGHSFENKNTKHVDEITCRDQLKNHLAPNPNMYRRASLLARPRGSSSDVSDCNATQEHCFPFPLCLPGRTGLQTTCLTATREMHWCKIRVSRITLTVQPMLQTLRPPSDHRNAPREHCFHSHAAYIARPPLCHTGLSKATKTAQTRSSHGCGTSARLFCTARMSQDPETCATTVYPLSCRMRDRCMHVEP